MNFIELKSGLSVEGAKIKAYRSDVEGTGYFYLMAGVHGDEVEGVYILQQLFEWLKSQDIELPMIVIPVQNVDGYRAGTRVNSNGVDLNRNFPTKSWSPEIRAAKYHPGTQALSEPENIYLLSLFKKFAPRLIFSLHSWKPMINYNGACQDIAELLSTHNKYITCDDIEGHPTPGSLGDYGPQEMNCPVLTFECPLLESGLGLNEIWEENRQAMEAMMTSDILKKHILG